MRKSGRRDKDAEPEVEIDLLQRLQGSPVEPPPAKHPAARVTDVGNGAPPASAPATPPVPLQEAGAATAPRPAHRATGNPSIPPPDPNIDRLTDLLGPSVFERLLAAESARARRYRRPTTLVLTELAGLEALSRAWGLDVGIEALISLADVLRATSRTSDYIARIATDRFAIILTETDEIAAINYVERVREAWGAQQAIAVGALRVGIGWAGTPGRATLLEARPIAEQMLRDDLAG